MKKKFKLISIQARPCELLRVKTFLYEKNINVYTLSDIFCHEDTEKFTSIYRGVEIEVDLSKAFKIEFTLPISDAVMFLDQFETIFHEAKNIISYSEVELSNYLIKENK